MLVLEVNQWEYTVASFKIPTFDLEERDTLACQVTLLSDALANLERALQHSRDIGVAIDFGSERSWTT